jgi:hypothetical protein
MESTHNESLSALLDLGEKSLSEGEYLKLAAFLKGLKDSAKPAPHRVTINNLEITVEFETQDGNKMCICIDKVRTLHYTGPDQDIIIGSINGIAMEMDEDTFINKVKLIYRVYGMKNITRTTTFCDPVMYKSLGEFKKWCNDHMANHYADSPDDLDSENWRSCWLFRNLYCLNDEY